MKNIKNEYKGFLDDIEKNIKNKEDLEYVKKRFTAFLDPVLDEINSIIEYKKEEVEELEKRQQEIERKMSKMQSVIDNIEKDIYAEDGSSSTSPLQSNSIKLLHSGHSISVLFSSTSMINS